MTEQQIPKLVGALVEHQVAFASLGTEDAQWAIQNTVEAINLCVTAIQNRETGEATKPQSQPSILKLIGTVTIPGVTEKFVAKDKFVRDIGHKAKVKISYIGENFTNWFKDKVEDDDSLGGDLVPLVLTRNDLDNEIIAALGGEDAAEVGLADIWRLMERQANGEQGVLLTNGYANIFYVRDIEGTLRAVRVYWGGSGWRVDATPVGYPFRWDAGSQVFSRNFCAL